MALVLDNNNFDQEVLKSDIPVFVDFYADWCGPCKSMAPLVEELSGELEGKVKVCKINVDNAQEIAARYRVMTIPTFMIFNKGEAADTMIGVMPKQVLVDKINAVL